MDTFISILNYLFGFSMPISHIGGYVTAGLAFLFSWSFWKKVRTDRFFLWMRLLLIYGFIRAVFSKEPNIGFSVMAGYLSHWFFPFLLGYAAKDMITVKRSFYIYFITFSAIVFLSLFAFFGFFKPVFGQFQLVYEGLLKGGRSHIALAAILLMLSAFSIGQAVFNREIQGRFRAGFIILSLFFLSAIFLTGSRGYYIAAALTVSAFCVSLVFFVSAAKKRFVIAGLGVVVLLSAGMYFTVPSIRDRIQRIGGSDASVSDRLLLYRVAAMEIKSNPVFGFGPGQAARQAEFFDKLPAEKSYLKDYGHLHSFYLHFTADFGLLGLGLFLVMILTGFKELWAVFRQSADFKKALAFGIFWSLIGVMLGDCLDTLLRGPGVAMELFWFTGLVLGLGSAKGTVDEPGISNEKPAGI